MPSLNYIDLFAGCGGLSTGLHLAGWKGLFAIEQNLDAFSTLKANLIEKRGHFDWPAWLTTKNWEIKKLLRQKHRELAKLRRTVDLVVGGPPCQGFSMAGRRRETDQRNNLIHSYVSLIQLVQPKAILFENVRGFTLKFKANAEVGTIYPELVIQKLKELGYQDAHGEIIDMSDYGVPQRRQRFIVVATRANVAREIFSALETKGSLHLAAKCIPKRNSAKAALSDLEQRHGVAPCPDSEGFHSGIASRPITDLQKYLRVDAEPHTPDSHRFVNHTLRVQNVFSRLLADAPRNSSISGAARKKFRLKKRSITVLAADRPAPTVTTIPDDLVHYSEPRVMTVRECARLQTFPDWFEFKGPYTTGGKQRVLETPRYTQVGNAVPPLFAELIGLAAKEILEDV